MGIFSRIFKSESPEKRAITWEQLDQLGGWLNPPTYSNVIVSEAVALGLSSLWCGIRTISQDVGTLEPCLYHEDDDGNRELELDHPVYTLIAEAPNEEMTRPVFFEVMMSHALLWGNSYAEIERNKAGEPVALWPIPPQTVQVKRTNGHIEYHITNAAGLTILQPENVIHIVGLSENGSVGYRLTTIARESIGFGVAAMRFGSSLFANAARPSGIISTPNELTDNARNNITKTFRELYAGAENAGRNILLESGMTWNAISQTNEQTQYKDVLGWIVLEISRWLVIPPSKLFDLQRATWGNLGALQQEYLNTTLRTWLVKIEKELERKLLTQAERKTLYIEFDTTDVLRADIATRYAAYAIALNNQPFRTVNEIRAEENLPPIEDGDKLPPKADLKVAPPALNIPENLNTPIPSEYNAGNTLY